MRTSTQDRVAIIGDIGGHSEELFSALVRLGADPHTLDLPPDLIVVQVGDLIHRGPDSVGVLAIVWEIMQRQPVSGYSLPVITRRSI